MTRPMTILALCDRLELLKGRITDCTHSLERQVWMEAYQKNLTALAVRPLTGRTLIHYCHYAAWYAVMTDAEDRLKLQPASERKY